MRTARKQGFAHGPTLPLTQTGRVLAANARKRRQQGYCDGSRAWWHPGAAWAPSSSSNGQAARGRGSTLNSRLCAAPHTPARVLNARTSTASKSYSRYCSAGRSLRDVRVNGIVVVSLAAACPPCTRVERMARNIVVLRLGHVTGRRASTSAGRAPGPDCRADH